MKYGYASAPEPEALQSQVEMLENEGIPKNRQYVEIVNRGHKDRRLFDAMMQVAKKGDRIAICNFTAVGMDLLDAYSRLVLIESQKIKIDVLDKPNWATEGQIINAFKYFGEIFNCQKQQEPARGKPRQPYPPGWRHTYLEYTAGNKTVEEACTELGISDYNFFRMLRRYRQQQIE